LKKIAAIFYKKPFWLFFLFLVVAYLPVLLPFFYLKNDLLTQNLPTRFVFGESLYSGFEPFWNPYLHYGNPQYGDMNNGFWNPLQWLIGATSGYNIYTITFEELFYILIGGWGIYKASKELFSKDVALLTGLAYMCSGYITGHMQYLCWITGTAYFPYVLLYFIRINKNPIVKNFLLGGISVFLFVASTHPGLIIGAAYFFAFALLIIYFNRNNFLREFYHPKFWKINSLFFFISCLLSIVVIVSNIDVLKHISRGSKVSLEEALMAPTTFQSYLSVYLPMPVHKTDIFNTDIAMRNVYIGLAHFTGIFILSRFLNKRILISFIIPLSFFILLAAGGYFKAFAWEFLPLIGFVRLNGEFTYFVILILFLYGSAGLQQFINKKNPGSNINILSYLKWASIIIAASAIIVILSTHSSFIFSNIPDPFSIKGIIKSLIDNSSFWDLLFIQAIIQAAIIYLVKKSIGNKTRATLLLCLNLIVITWLTLPFTGLGITSKKEVQSVINTFPRGIQPQGLVAINDAEYIKPADENQFLLISSYSKKIGYTKPDQYPVQLSSNNDFITDTALYSFIKKQAFLFLSNDITINTTTDFDSAHIQVLRSGPGYTKCIINNESFKWLTLLQNNYQYWEVRIDGKRVNHQTGFRTFISVPVEHGVHTIEFEFKPTLIKISMWVNLVLLFVALVVILTPKLTRQKILK
jgi:CTP:phosphocholine cytidylyltransferase-like protein